MHEHTFEYCEPRDIVYCECGDRWVKDNPVIENFRILDDMLDRAIFDKDKENKQN